MSEPILVATRRLVRAASAVYADDPVATRQLRRHEARLHEPMRVAIAGMTKAGKSTLLNAIVGADVALTDAGECTRIVTWYRYGETPRVTVFPLDGAPRVLDVEADAARIAFVLGPTRAEEVERIEVEWPAPLLRSMTLIDTPGLASLTAAVAARAADFLAPSSAPSEVDAVIYVLRHLHVADLTFLQSFRDTTRGSSGVVNAVAVLSRADEIGAGRIDALLSARDIAERYRHDDTLRSVTLGVLPVAGLIAQSARILDRTRFDALAELARLDRGARERMLISSDRFTRPLDDVTVSAPVRASLVDQLGIFGIRLAIALIRGGASDPAALAEQFAERSGLNDLLRSIDGQFTSRTDYLVARTALTGIESLLGSRPRDDAGTLADDLERITAGSHELSELRLLSVVRGTGVAVPPDVSDQLERLIGGDGTSARQRLGLPPGAGSSEVRDRALEQLARWRRLGENPLIDRGTAQVCRIVTRSCEGILADVGDPVPAQ